MCLVSQLSGILMYGNIKCTVQKDNTVPQSYSTYIDEELIKYAKHITTVIVLQEIHISLWIWAPEPIYHEVPFTMHCATPTVKCMSARTTAESRLLRRGRDNGNSRRYSRCR